ncbi:hypothetical protein HELRODRAFT_175396 [Helobdella robusta]|uniref:Uncharacterized protein n=1 Tax=Helobdella robusta TaxID=6412 RepID=T1F985_HELRO|nr:hypothetical protein HELRODRAFT_175396 [Helobdella robusta]ESO00900.1 hypothetical protein HELRODRAFT_175396 [Helobdella robusta]
MSEGFSKGSKFKQDMKPYVHNTIHRLNEYCANVGVTDRFQGYRNNINLGVKDPMACPSSVDQNTDEELCPEECCCDCCCPTELGAAPDDDDKLPKCPAKSVQEQYGINTCYPGSSEYTDQ